MNESLTGVAAVRWADKSSYIAPAECVSLPYATVQQAGVLLLELLTRRTLGRICVQYGKHFPNSRVQLSCVAQVSGARALDVLSHE